MRVTFLDWFWVVTKKWKIRRPFHSHFTDTFRGFLGPKNNISPPIEHFFMSAHCSVFYRFAASFLIMRPSQGLLKWRLESRVKDGVSNAIFFSSWLKWNPLLRRHMMISLKTLLFSNPKSGPWVFLWKVKPFMDLWTEWSYVRFIMSKTISRYIFEIRINNLE